MSTRNDGGPAFPCAPIFDERRGEMLQYASEGMTLRDYFAAKALAGIASVYHESWTATSAAAAAYELADAMLEARDR